jgi:hypothetical protein
MDSLAYIGKKGSQGSGNANLDTPYGLALDDAFVYIADSANGRVVKWKHSGEYVAENSGDFTDPRDIAIWKDRLFVADNGTGKIHVLTKGLTERKTITATGVTSCCIGDGFLFFTGTSKVFKYDLRTLTQTASVANALSKTQIAFDPHEKIVYVGVSGTGVSKYAASDFTTYTGLTATDSTDGSLTGLNGVCIKDHYLYITEANRIQVFDCTTLTTRNSAGSSGTGNTNIGDGGFITSHRDTLWFSDQSNHRITVWNDHNPRRDITAGDALTIGGKFWQHPFAPIGGKQDRVDRTIGGTAETDLAINLEEEPANDRWLGQEES